MKMRQIVTNHGGLGIWRLRRFNFGWYFLINFLMLLIKRKKKKNLEGTQEKAFCYYKLKTIML